MAPEYAVNGLFSVKSDVFSFGILLLEIMSSRKAIDVSHSPPSIVDWAIPLVKKGNIVHELSFFFYMKVPADFEPVCNSFTEDGNKEHLVWIRADHNKKYYPEFFKTELANPSKEVKHYVTRQIGSVIDAVNRGKNKK